MQKGKKVRLDFLVQQQMPELSRTLISGLIVQGKVFVDGQLIVKPGVQVYDNVPLRVDFEEPKYVGRAGFKLERALEHFNIDVSGFIALDAGLSTGGFTDCLLQNGAKKVYGVDVGHGQVHEKIRNDDRVVIMERINLRHLKELPDQVDLVTLDLSFISVLKVIDVVKNLMKPDGKLVVLIKPQFEAEKHQVGKGGIVKNQSVHQEVIDKVTTGIEAAGFKLVGIVPSPIKGGDGNIEFLGYFNYPL